MLILTKNEAHDLPDCLRSVSWSDDIHVLDSISVDETVSIATKAGALVVQRAFDGYASQRNFGLKEIAYRHAWVLLLDADERIPENLAAELIRFVRAAPDTVSAGRMKRRDIWWGRWLRHAQISPLFIRLVRPDRVHFEREVNEVAVVDGEILDVDGYFDHYPFSKGLDHWISKHNVYSSMEAALIARGRIPRPSWRIAFFGTDFNIRRVHQKAIFYALPARPLVKFAYMMLVRGAFLDGMPGVRYAFLQAIYEYFIVLKSREIETGTCGKYDA